MVSCPVGQTGAETEKRRGEEVGPINIGSCPGTGSLVRLVGTNQSLQRMIREVADQ